MQSCQLCGRAVEVLTAHHLYPKSQGRRTGRKIAELPTVRVCRACHRQIHALFSNKELARELDDLKNCALIPKWQSFSTGCASKTQISALKCAPEPSEKQKKAA